MKLQGIKYQIFAWILLVFLNVNFFTQLYIISDFYIHRDEISANLCVQRKVKNNCCQGKCQLEKRLSKTSTESPENNPSQSNTEQNAPFGSSNWMIQFSHIDASIQFSRFGNEYPKQTFEVKDYSEDIPSPPPRLS